MAYDNTALFILLKQMIEEQKYNFKTSLEFILSYYNNPQDKIELSLLLTEIYEAKIKGGKADLEAEKIHNFYNQFPWE